MHSLLDGRSAPKCVQYDRAMNLTFRYLLLLALLVLPDQTAGQTEDYACAMGDSIGNIGY